MLGKSVYKVPNGKLLKVTLEFDDDAIKRVRLTGDFFAYPEEAMAKIEDALAGKGLSKESLIAEIKKTADMLGARFFGIDAEGIVEAIFLARGAGA